MFLKFWRVWPELSFVFYWDYLGWESDEEEEEDDFRELKLRLSLWETMVEKDEEDERERV